jgi:hypothetical protein
MFSRLACLFLAGVCCLAGASASAHEDAGHQAPPILDCDDPPEQAARVVPPPIANWTQLDCVPAGQVLIQAEDWVWRYPGSFTDRPSVPAWMSADPGVSGEPRYFTSITVRQAGAEEAHRLNQRFVKSMIELPAAAGAAAARERIYVLIAQSNLGEKLEVNFVYRSDQDIWAIPCAPDCRPEQLFHIYRRQ